MKYFYTFFFIIFCFFVENVRGQETLPVYSDYLSDNVYLVHPSAAGFRECTKIRLTARTQWSGVENAPSLQTISFNTRLGENNGIGAIIFNDKNGYHSRQGIQGTYAYHLNIGDIKEYKTVSFGLSFMMVNNNLDERSFTIPDPVISQIVQSESYFNADASVAYHTESFFSYLTAKNVMLNTRNVYNSQFESLNLRRYLVTLGHYFDISLKGQQLELEPSVLIQFIEQTKEKFVDFNIKAYKDFIDANIWLAISYRRGFDSNSLQQLSYFSPIVGATYKNYMLAYTYSKQTGDILFDDAGYHQLTLGYTFGCSGDRRFWNERAKSSNKMF